MSLRGAAPWLVPLIMCMAAYATAAPLVMPVDLHFVYDALALGAGVLLVLLAVRAGRSKGVLTHEATRAAR